MKSSTPRRSIRLLAGLLAVVLISAWHQNTETLSKFLENSARHQALRPREGAELTAVTGGLEESLTGVPHAGAEEMEALVARLMGPFDLSKPEGLDATLDETAAALIAHPERYEAFLKALDRWRTEVDLLALAGIFARLLVPWSGLPEPARARCPVQPAWSPDEARLGQGAVTLTPGVLRHLIMAYSSYARGRYYAGAAMDDRLVMIVQAAAYRTAGLTAERAAIFDRVGTPDGTTDSQGRFSQFGEALDAGQVSLDDLDRVMQIFVETRQALRLYEATAIFPQGIDYPAGRQGDHYRCFADIPHWAMTPLLFLCQDLDDQVGADRFHAYNFEDQWANALWAIQTGIELNFQFAVLVHGGRMIPKDQFPPFFPPSPASIRYMAPALARLAMSADGTRRVVLGEEFLGVPAGTTCTVAELCAAVANALATHGVQQAFVESLQAAGHTVPQLPPRDAGAEEGPPAGPVAPAPATPALDCAA